MKYLNKIGNSILYFLKAPERLTFEYEDRTGGHTFNIFFLSTIIIGLIVLFFIYVILRIKMKMVVSYSIFFSFFIYYIYLYISGFIAISKNIIGIQELLGQKNIHYMIR